MDFKGINIYPLVSVEIEKIKDKDFNNVHFSTWIRLKRKKKYYYVLFVNCVSSTSTAGHLLFMAHLNNFLTQSQNLKHLWELPNKETRKERIKYGHLIKDTCTLSNRDKVLLNKQL